MMFVVGAMAALSIDVVTLYTARSEAQLAADAAALGAARVLANSGATSDTTGVLLASAETSSGPARTVATQVATQNEVGGVPLTSANVTITFGGSTTNPTVTAQVQVATLPTFFSRIWGRTQMTVSASATAEAYNPSGAPAVGKHPVAPSCVKPWLLPNLDPSSANLIFDTTTGTIGTVSLLGFTGPPLTLAAACSGTGGCTLPLGTPPPWNYYPGDPGTSSFPPPTSALPTCTLVPTPTPYQESIAGCIQKPISCNQTVTIDTGPYSGSTGGLRGPDTSGAVNCLTHASPNNGGDQVTSTAPPTAPFEFVAGSDNPIPGLATKDVMVSDSLVTVPVYNSTATTCTAAPCTVTIVGFVQLFLNPDGSAAPLTTGVNTTVINLAGCGTNATGQAILGNGASPVAVRLISP